MQKLIHDKLIPKWKDDLTTAFEIELQHQKVLFDKYGMNWLLSAVTLVIYFPNLYSTMFLYLISYEFRGTNFYSVIAQISSQNVFLLKCHEMIATVLFCNLLGKMPRFGPYLYPFLKMLPPEKYINLMLEVRLHLKVNRGFSVSENALPAPGGNIYVGNF